MVKTLLGQFSLKSIFFLFIVVSLEIIIGFLCSTGVVELPIAITLGLILLFTLIIFPKIGLYLVVFFIGFREIDIYGISLSEIILIPSLIIWGVHFFVIQNEQIEKNNINQFVVMFLFWGLLTIAWSPNLIQALKQSMRLVTCAILFFYITNNLKNTKAFLESVYVWIFLGMVSSLYAFYQFLSQGIQKIAMNYSTIIPIASKDTRPSAFMKTPVDLAALLGLILPISLALIFYSEKRSVKVINLLCGLLLIFGIISSFTRGAWIALAVSVMFLFLFLKESRKIFITFGIITFILLPFTGIDFLEALFVRLSTIFTFETTATGISERLQAWITVVDIIKTNPLSLYFGIGIGGWEGMGDIYSITTRLSLVHNLYLQILLEYGIIGLSAFIAFVGNIIYQIYDLIKADLDRKNLLLLYGILGGIVYLLVLGLTFLNFVERYIWVYFAISVALINIINKNRVK